MYRYLIIFLALLFLFLFIRQWWKSMPIQVAEESVMPDNLSVLSGGSCLSDIIKILIRQIGRWAVAAQQDQNPLIALLHVNYATGYLWAVKDIATSEQVKAATGLELKTLERQITSLQDSITKNATKTCPAFMGTADKFLSEIAGDN